MKSLPLEYTNKVKIEREPMLFKKPDKKHGRNVFMLTVPLLIWYLKQYTYSGVCKCYNGHA